MRRRSGNSDGGGKGKSPTAARTDASASASTSIARRIYGTALGSTRRSTARLAPLPHHTYQNTHRRRSRRGLTAPLQRLGHLLLLRRRLPVLARIRIRIHARIVIMNIPPNLRRRVALPLNLALSNTHTRI